MLPVEGGKSNPCPVSCKCGVIGIFRTGSKEKITWPNLLFPVNEELRLPFTILEGSSEVPALHSWCLTAVSVHLSLNAQVHGRGSFITVTSTYLSHCHPANGFQAVELSALSCSPPRSRKKASQSPFLPCYHVSTWGLSNTSPRGFPQSPRLRG